MLQTRQILPFCALLLQVLLLGGVVPPPVSAFVQQPQLKKHTSSSLITLEAWNASPRRQVFSWFKKAFFVGAASTALSKEVRAEEEDLGGGPIVELQVDNLDGEPSSGTVRIQLVPDWAPKGVDRFTELTKLGFWDDCRVFRVLPGFVVQFGINGDPSVQAKWRGANLPDDPVKVSNERGTVVFATAGPNSRTTQIFINTRDQGNAFLDKQGFAPIGKVIQGMDIVDRMYAGYGEGAPAGKGPNQGLIQLRGNSYLKEQYPKLSFIKKGSLV